MTHPGNATAAVIATLALFASSFATVTGATPTSSGDTESTRIPGVLVTDTLNGHGETIDLNRPGTAAGMAALREAPLASAQVPVGGFLLCHEPSVPAAVLDDVRVALEIWSATLDLDGPAITIDFGWVPLTGDSSLGIAGPNEFVMNSRLPSGDTAYPIALANQLLGIDQNGAGCGEDRAEVVLYLNRNAGGDGSLWNIGDDQLGDDQVDLSTVVLHEIGHGLGLVSSARLVGNSVEWPHSGSSVYAYDRYFGECANESPNGCDSGVTPLAPSSSSNLRSSRVWFRSSGGHALELYAPETWSGGSSISHLDEVRYPAGSGFSLMTPFLRRGEAFTAIDSALQSVVQTIGWSLATVPVAPTGVSATAGNGGIDVAFTRPALEAGPPTTGYRITATPADGRPARSVDTTSGSATMTGLTNGTAYQIDVRSLNTAGASAPAAASDSRIIPLELPPFATAETAARQLHLDLLGVAPTAADTAATSARLRSSSSLADEAARLAADSRLERRLQVIRLYLGFFQRDPDPTGLEYWFGEVSSGVSLDVVASSFAIASEFERGREVPDTEFIDAAYRRILERAPDEAGRAYWTTQLGRGLDRGQMLILFSESAEHVAKTRVSANVIAMSFGMLDRAPTVAERAEWSAVVARSGAPGLARQLATSDPYGERHQPR